MARILATRLTAADLIALGSTNYATFNSADFEPNGWNTTGYDVKIITPFASAAGPGTGIYAGVGIPSEDSKLIFISLTTGDVVYDEIFAADSDTDITQLTCSGYVDTGNLSDVNAGEAELYLLGEFMSYGPVTQTVDGSYFGSGIVDPSTLGISIPQINSAYPVIMYVWYNSGTPVIKSSTDGGATWS